MANSPIQYHTYAITKELLESVIDIEVVQAARIEDVASYIERESCGETAPPSSMRFLESQNDYPFCFSASYGSTPFDSCKITFEKRRFGNEFVMFITIDGYRHNGVNYYIKPAIIKQIDPQ